MYTLIRIYDDGYTQEEKVDSIVNLFSAASIYTYDEECIELYAFNDETHDNIITFRR